MRMPLFVIAALAAATLINGSAAAQSYPNRPVRIVVPFPAGGPTDVQSRILAEKLSERWKQQVIVDDRPGGNTIIGAVTVAKAVPDGYTLLMAIDSTLVMNQYLYATLPYDPFKDFGPITRVVRGTTVIVTDAASGPATIKDLVERARAKPGTLSFGAGTITTQLAGEMFKQQLGLNIITVPFKGSSPSVQALLAHDVSYIVDGLAPSVPHLKSGTFRALAVTGARHAGALPGVPTLAEAADLPGFDIATWQGLMAPAGTPRQIIAKLHDELGRVLTLPEVTDKLATFGLTADPSKTPEEFAGFIRIEAERWAKVIPTAGIHLD
ncbi:MAG: tripartite tricarboxylate transporter substrate binding protein [Alphaproteobacteria bacterium]|nr:tripartite tricarboxylate transporter substrate binding protein [Alphaproteobacteria bacterium]